jgi:metal-sulfur cluster biosynthetic enzyme
MTSTQLNETGVLDRLRQVIDPEIGCNIVDLGLVYRVAINGGVVKIVMTLTTRGCPMHDSISQGVTNALLSLEAVDDVEVQVVWDPPWHPSMMTEEGRRFTGVQIL